CRRRSPGGGCGGRAAAVELRERRRGRRTPQSIQSAPMPKLAVLFFSLFALQWSTVAPDIEQRLAKFKPVEMPFTFEDYSKREVRLIHELVAALRDLEDIYWRQNNPDDIAIWQGLAGDKTARGKALRRYLWINGSRLDQIKENEAFIGHEPDPPARHLYPKGIPRDEIEAYVKAHPNEKAKIYDERTVVELVSRNP